MNDRTAMTTRGCGEGVNNNSQSNCTTSPFAVNKAVRRLQEFTIVRIEESVLRVAHTSGDISDHGSRLVFW